MNKQVIVFNGRDRVFLLARLRSILNQCDSTRRPKLLAFAILGNHLHLLFQHGAVATEVRRIMSALKRDYAHYFNEQHGTTGPVWESPFRGRVVRGGEELINVVTYIHLNPDSSTRDANSSHGIYLGEQPAGIVSTELVLKTFGGRDAYEDYFADTSMIRAARAAAKRRINK